MATVIGTDSGPMIPFSRTICICRHMKGQHALGINKCDNCDCSKFKPNLSVTAADDDLTGAMCVTPEAANPSQDIVSESKSMIPEEVIPARESGLKDSGKRLAFASGMVRDVDDDKPGFDLIIPEGIPYSELMLTRWAELLRKGAIKYSRRNWEKADSQEELDRAKGSAFRHFMQWFSGETDEDHAAAVFFNINEVETIKYKQKEKS
jgi:hypothetical protein